MNYVQLKEEIFGLFHRELRDISAQIQNSNESKNVKAKRINVAVETSKVVVENSIIPRTHDSDRPKLFMLIQYCFTVVSLEYRHSVWPYEYMAFSRRNGELWEKFCKAAWDHSEKNTLFRIDAPSFYDVRNSFYQNLQQYQLSQQQIESLTSDFNSIFELVGEINMIEDEMFNLHGQNHIIDFKSGFGSNEKGNTLRLLAVGKAYQYWDENVNLLFLVRQNDNNNYLEKIRQSNIWNIFCGDEAYRKIDELTDAGISEIRSSAIDFQNDLSNEFWNHLVQNDLNRYLTW